MFGLVEGLPKLGVRKNLSRLRKFFLAETTDVNLVQRERRVTSSAFPSYRLRLKECDMMFENITIKEIRCFRYLPSRCNNSLRGCRTVIFEQPSNHKCSVSHYPLNGHSEALSAHTELSEIISQEQLHHVLCTGAGDVSQIGFPCYRAIRALNDLVTWKVINIAMCSSPLLGD